MNRINPFYLGFLLIALILFLSFKLNSAKTDLLEVKKAYKESEKLGVELSGLKKAYSKKFKLSSFKSASLVQKKTKKGVIISSKSMDIKVLNSLMGKLLNGTYNITDMKIKKLSDTKVSLHLEIKW